MNENYINSSYKLNNFQQHFKEICKKYNPKSILEIGILDGYSLKAFSSSAKRTTKITAIDLFDKYEFKNSNFDEITKLFQKNKNVSIKHGDFYEYFKLGEKFDIIHIDISNDANVYKFSIQNYFPLTNKLMILEGGSKERDKVDWMVKYNKPKINNYLQSIKNCYDFDIIEKFPSITIFYKNLKIGN